MICPQTKAEMTCPHIEGCFVVGCNGDCESPPPKPSLAEIERLVDAFESAVCGKIYYPDSDLFAADYDKARQQLIAFGETISSKAV